MCKISLTFMAALLLNFASPISAGDLSKPTASVSSTETLPAAGTVRVEDPRGELSIEGWDQPQVEITVKKSGRLVEHAQIKSERRGEEIVISTDIPKHDRRDVNVEYKIKAPRDSKIVISQAEGGVYVTGIAGDIDASVHRGQITLSLPENAAYKIDAHTKLGSVYSEFDGNDKRRHLFSHDFDGTANTPTRQLNLRVVFGDIVILKAYTGQDRAK
jgi:hypothetical protein